MAQNNIFDPPTAEELAAVKGNMFAPPSEEELRGIAAPNAPAGKNFLQRTADGLSDFVRGTGEGVPGYGLLQKAGAATAAGIAKATYDDRPYDDIYSEILKDDIGKDREASKRSPYANIAGNLVGGLAGPGVTGGNAVTRIAGNAALGALDVGTRGENLFDKDRAESGGMVAGGVSAGLEALPYIGRAAGLAAKKSGSILFGVGDDATSRYLENPEKMRDVISQGADGLRSIKDRVDEAYFNKVTKIREDAAAGLIDAKAAAAEARKEAIAYQAALQNIKPPEHLTGEVMGAVGNEKSKLSNLSSKAFDTLDGTSFNRDEILSELDKIKSKMLVDGQKPKLGDAVGGYNIIEKLQSAIASRNKPETDSLMNVINEAPGLEGSDLKRFIQQLDQESSAKAYSQFGGTGNDEYIKGIRRPLDSMLKGKVPAYADAMVPTAKQAELVSKLTDIFGDPDKARRALLMAADPEKGPMIMTYLQGLDKNNGTKIADGLSEYINAQKLLKDPEAVLMRKAMMTNDAERGLQSARQSADQANALRSKFSRLAPGSSEGTIERVGRDRNIEGQKQMQELMGDEGMQDAKDYALGRDFVTDKTRGARRTAAGAIVGGAVGSLLGPAGTAIGTAAGSAVGATIDRNGGKIWQSILDGKIKADDLAQRVPPEFRSALMRAAEGGPRALAATYYAITNGQGQ